MSTSVLVIGKSGTGKSRSMLNLDPATTFLINVNGKDLPFVGHKAKYQRLSNNNLKGNMAVTDKYEQIISAINYVNDKRPEIKVAVIDDFQYVMSNLYMARATEKAVKDAVFQMYKEIGSHAFHIIRACNACRDDLVWVFLSHSEESDTGETKIKTIGKMLDNVIVPEGMFTVVLNTATAHLDGKTEYYFETQNNGRSTAKSPEGMFENFKIPNDLKMVVDSINAYNNGGQ
ncbi:MAG: ATP-binding protein [Chitinispirillales bacterium]|jgi:ABC-type oligopeptide transport system ATPase subunit|nr:ATP-binding protein [Chitinispirillales bacterium]